MKYSVECQILHLLPFIIFPAFFLCIVFCCGSISFILNGLIVLRVKPLSTSGKRLIVSLVLAIFYVWFLRQF